MRRTDREAPLLPTLLQACELAGLLAPVSLSETITALRVLKIEGIRHNLEGEPVYETLMREEDKR
jgi:hypothetical protein